MRRGTDISWESPITRPPNTAPYGEPIPPTITAAKIRRITLNPIVGLRTPMRPNRMPAVDAKEQLRAHAAYVTRFVLMPVAFASYRLSAVARMAFPRLVYVNRM